MATVVYVKRAKERIVTVIKISFSSVVTVEELAHLNAGMAHNGFERIAPNQHSRAVNTMRAQDVEAERRRNGKPTA